MYDLDLKEKKVSLSFTYGNGQFLNEVFREVDLLKSKTPLEDLTRIMVTFSAFLYHVGYGEKDIQSVISAIFFDDDTVGALTEAFLDEASANGMIKSEIEDKPLVTNTKQVLENVVSDYGLKKDNRKEAKKEINKLLRNNENIVAFVKKMGDSKKFAKSIFKLYLEDLFFNNE